MQVPLSAFTWTILAMALTSLLAVFVTAWRRHFKSSNSASCKAPPGPSFPWTFMGSLGLSTIRFHYRQATEWAKQYGSIIGIKVGSVNVVILSDFEQIRDFFSRPELQYRPSTWGLSRIEKGFSAFNGQEWKANRDLSARALAKVSSEGMRRQIQEEAQQLADSLAAHEGRPVACRQYLHRSAVNTISRFLLGYRYDLEDPRRRPLDEALEGFKLESATVPVEHRAAWLRTVLLDRLMPSSPSANRERLFTKLHAVVRDLVDINESTRTGERNESYIDIYMERIRQAEKDGSQYFSVSRLVGNLIDLLMGAVTTGPVFLYCHLLNLANRSDTLQVQLQREIDTVVGRDRAPTWEDHVHMPLTMATMWEMFRWKMPTPFNIPRGKSLDEVGCPMSIALAEAQMILKRFKQEKEQALNMGEDEPRKQVAVILCIYGFWHRLKKIGTRYRTKVVFSGRNRSAAFVELFKSGCNEEANASGQLAV
ncbi:farnesoate epoxidase-like [Haemaphysalis longicornis]